jgi:hypothetical protein
MANDGAFVVIAFILSCLVLYVQYLMLWSFVTANFAAFGSDKEMNIFTDTKKDPYMNRDHFHAHLIIMISIYMFSTVILFLQKNWILFILNVILLVSAASSLINTGMLNKPDLKAGRTSLKIYVPCVYLLILVASVQEKWIQ